MSHIWFFLVPVSVLETYAGANAQLELWLFMDRNNAVKMIQYEGVDSILHWFVLLRAAQKLEIEFCLQDMSTSLAFLAVGQHE